MNVVIRRVATTAAGLVAPLILLAPAAEVGLGAECSYAVDPLNPCQSIDGGVHNSPSPVEFPVGFPGAL